MPSQTPKQHRAMEAAAHGKSTLGIPQKVGSDFVKADAGKPAMLAKGGKLVDHGDHFKIHDVAGNVHTVAHHGLSPATVKHLQKFAEGGEAAPDMSRLRDNADSEHGLDIQGNEEASNRRLQDEAQKANDQEDSDYAAAQQAASPGVDNPGREASAEDQTPGQPALQGGFIDKTADTGNKLGADAGTAPPETPPGVNSDNVQMGKFVAAKVHDVTPQEIAAKDAANAARSANSAEHDRITGERNAAADEEAKSLKALQASSDIHYAEIQKRAADLRQGIADGKIDPNHYWAEKGTGGRIAASIGLLLSGLGSGLGGGPNMAMQVIKSNIDRDIDAQKANLETKKSLLSDTYRETGDLRLATQMAQHTAMNVALAQMNKLAGQSQNADVKARNEVASQVANESLAQSARQIADKRSANQAAATNANTAATNTLALQKAKKGDEAKIPREMQGAKIGNLNSTLKDLDNHLTHLGEGAQGPIAGGIAEHFPWGGANTKANAAAADVLREKLASALGGGVASDARIKQAIASVPGPSDTPEQARVKIGRIKELVTTQRDEYIDQQGGVGFRVAPGSKLPGSVPPAPTRKQ